MENENTMRVNAQISIDDSMRQTHECTCEYQELHKFPKLCKAYEKYRMFKNNYSKRPDLDRFEESGHVKSILSSIQKETSIYMTYPYEDFISKMIHLISHIIETDNHTIEILVELFKEIITDHISDIALQNSCCYILDDVYSFPEIYDEF